MSAQTGVFKKPGLVGNKHGVTHGMSYTGTYRSWVAMRQRCGVRAGAKPAYVNVPVCPEWQTDFKRFLADMGERPPGTTLDREDGTKGYSKDNCRWATPKEQQRNTKNLRMLTAAGKTQCLADWAAELNITPEAINQRIKQGWSVEKAVSTPRFY